MHFMQQSGLLDPDMCNCILNKNPIPRPQDTTFYLQHHIDEGVGRELSAGTAECFLALLYQGCVCCAGLVSLTMSLTACYKIYLFIAFFHGSLWFKILSHLLPVSLLSLVLVLALVLVLSILVCDICILGLPLQGIKSSSLDAYQTCLESSILVSVTGCKFTSPLNSYRIRALASFVFTTYPSSSYQRFTQVIHKRT